MRAAALLVLAVLTGCAAPAPPAAIPGDLQLTCFRGQWVAVSEAAGEAMVFATRCGRDV